MPLLKSSLTLAHIRDGRRRGQRVYHVRTKDRAYKAAGGTAAAELYLPIYIRCSCKQSVRDVLAPTERSVFFFEALIILTGRARSFYAKIPDSLVPSATLRDKTSHVHEPACIKKRAQTQHGDIVCRGALRRRCIIMHASIATLVRVVRFFATKIQRKGSLSPNTISRLRSKQN